MAALKLVFHLSIAYIALSDSSGDIHRLPEVPAYLWEDQTEPLPPSLALTQGQRASHVIPTPHFPASWDCCEKKPGCPVDVQSHIQREEHEVWEGLQEPGRPLTHQRRKGLAALGGRGRCCCWEARPQHPGPPGLSPRGGRVGSAVRGQHPCWALAGVWGEWRWERVAPASSAALLPSPSP